MRVKIFKKINPKIRKAPVLPIVKVLVAITIVVTSQKIDLIPFVSFQRMKESIAAIHIPTDKAAPPPGAKPFDLKLSK